MEFVSPIETVGPAFHMLASFPTNPTRMPYTSGSQIVGYDPPIIREKILGGFETSNI